MLDSWIRKKIGAPKGAPLSRNELENYQLRALNKTLSHTKLNSAYYRKNLSGCNALTELRDIEKLPFTTTEDISLRPEDFLCVPASKVSRIVTLETSGTTGAPKRIYFTEDDQELMIDFIANGMKPMVSEGETFLVLMPCEKTGSVGDLVRIGLERFGVSVIPYGLLPFDGNADAEILDLIRDKNVLSMLATASAARRLALAAARANQTANAASAPRLRSVLLSAEYVSNEAVNDIEKVFGCKVFEHYGMTEMGLGGAVSCGVGEGYHVREADLIFEVIDPDTGTVVPDGESGEIVFTTLTREAMPLIRYRTGDFGRWITEPCSCGSVLKRLSRVGDRRIVKGY
jgi:phenylacetate-coenzyme A ligase PaaK-like adenylate-forming protein